MDPKDPSSWWQYIPFVLTAGQQHRGSAKSVIEAVLVAVLSGAVGGAVGVYATVAAMRAELTAFKDSVTSVVIKLEARDAILEQRIYELQLRKDRP